MEYTGERYIPSLKGQVRYEHLHRYALSLNFVSGKTVLDIASGEGYGAALLAGVARSVVGVDINPECVEHSKQYYQQISNLEYLLGSCESIPLPDASVDVVTSFETIEHHDKHQEMMREIKRVLKPNGRLIISSPNRLVFSDEAQFCSPFHVKELYYDEFQELLIQHFKFVRILGQKPAAASFVFPLKNSEAGNWASYSSREIGIVRNISSLPSPLFFLAICSDAEIDNQEIVTSACSVYIDSDDDLLTALMEPLKEEVERLESNILSMESSPFWKLRGMLKKMAGK